jgi:hypothetical protein
MFLEQRVIHDKTLKAWHGNVWPINSYARALAIRVRLARKALAIDRSTFYTACGLNPKAGKALEGLMCPSRRPTTRWRNSKRRSRRSRAPCGAVYMLPYPICPRHSAPMITTCHRSIVFR